MSTNDGKESKGNGSSNTVTILVAIISALVTIIVAFKDPIAAKLFPTPTVPAPVTVKEAALPTPDTQTSQLSFKQCPNDDACPGSRTMAEVLTESGQPGPYDFNVTYSLDIPQATTIRFAIGWCTKDSQLLQEHLPHFQFVFAIDGVSNQDKLGTLYDTVPYPEDPSINAYCHHIGVGVSNWQPGVRYRINFGKIQDIDLFDGWSNYSKGNFVRTYMITGK